MGTLRVATMKKRKLKKRIKHLTEQLELSEERYSDLLDDFISFAILPTSDIAVRIRKMRESEYNMKKILTAGFNLHEPEQFTWNAVDRSIADDHINRGEL